jgi:AcrR family transcriptional regulator
VARPLSDQDILDFREQACARATRPFAEHGFAGVTLRSLAAEMGCSPMTPYRYFENEQDIFRAVCVAASQRLGRRCRRWRPRWRTRWSGCGPRGREYVRFAQEEPHADRIVFQLEVPFAFGQDPDIDVELRRGWDTVHAAREECVKSGRLDGAPSPSPTSPGSACAGS